MKLHLPLSAALAALALPALAGVTLSPLWSVAPGTAPFPAAPDNTQRGIAYNPASGNVLMVNRTGAVNINVFNGLTGAQGANLNVTGISGGTFPLNCIGCTNDGVVYAANLVSPSGNTRIYRWGEEGEAPVLVFDANIGGLRWGDDMDVQGTGSNTRIILGRGTSGSDVCVLTTSDHGLPGTWTATQITVTGLPSGGARGGITSEGTGTTFFSCAPNASTLYYSNFNLTGPSATTTDSSALPAGGSGFTGLESHSADKLLAVIRISTAAAPGAGVTALYLLDITDPNNPITVASAGFPGNNQNSNGAGRAVFGTNVPGHPLVVFALATNSGLMAQSVVITPDVVPPTVASSPGDRTVYDRGQTTFSITPTGSSPLTYAWTHNGNPVGGNSPNLTVNPVSAASAGSYVCRVSNSAGFADSTPAVLTVASSLNTAALTHCWTLTPGSRPYLSASGETERGVDYDPVTNRLYLVSRNPSPQVYVLNGTTGADLHQLDVTDVSGGNFTLMFPGVADDGAVYVCNLSNTTTGGDFKIYKWPGGDPAVPPVAAYSGNPLGSRIGDSFDVRGSGAGLECVAGARNLNQFVLFRPDGLGVLVPTVITVADAPGGAFGLGIAFGEGNTVWGKNGGGNLLLCSYDPVSGTGAVIATYGTASGVTLSTNPIGVDTASRCLAMIEVGNPDNVRFFSYSAGSVPSLTLLDQEFIPTDNINGNGIGSVYVGAGKVYALDTNNGLSCYSTLKPALPELGAITPGPGANTSVQVRGTVGFRYVMEVSPDLTTPSWTALETILFDAAMETYVLPATAARQFWRARLGP